MSAKARMAMPDRVAEEATLDCPDQWLPDCVKEMLENAAASIPRQGGAESNKAAEVTAAYEEFSRRVEAGEALDAEDFCRQYPHLYSSLAGLIRCHSFLTKEEHLKIAKEQKLFPKPGDVFLGFELTKVLGRGGFARVFLAKEQALGDRVVVVKISKGGGAEADTLGPINHPNIVPVHSVQVDPVSGLTAVCMPYFGSETLFDILDCLHLVAGPCATAQNDGQPAPATASGKPPVQETAYIDNIRKIGIQLADALHFIHLRGIFHLDLKPSNVLLTADTRPMLLDFNLSNDARAEGARVGGTLPYMSPEQLLATDCEPMSASTMLDARSDLYSLGVMLYELLTGQHPYEPLSLNLTPNDLRVELLAKQRRGMVPIRRLNPMVHPKLARVVESCLAYNPEDRPGSAQDLALALVKAQSTWRVARRWLSSHRWLTAAAAGVILAFAGTAAAWSSLREPERREPDHERHWQLAQGAMDRKDYQGAVRHLNFILDENHGNTDALKARARAHILWGATKRDYYNSALLDLAEWEKAGANGEINASRAYCMLRLNWPLHRVIKELDEAIHNRFDTPEIHANLGYCHLHMDKLKEAEIELNIALERNSNLTAALHNRAMLRLAQVVKANSLVPPLKAQPISNMVEQKHKMGLDLLQQARNDMEAAIKDINSTWEQCADAARIWALSADYDPTYTNGAFNYMRRATELGFPAADFNNGKMFEHLKDNPRYQEILALPVVARPEGVSSRIVNPLPN